MFPTGQDTHQPVVISDGDDGTDDEFQTAPRDLEVQRYIEHPRVTRRPGGESLLKIHTRGIQPEELVHIVTSLTTRQQQDVIHIGMGGVMGLRVTEIPLRMDYWLLSNFDPAGMALKLANGSSITITKEDVATVLGLPNGIIPITERDGPIVGPELRAWRDKVNQRRGKITVRALGTLMLELKQGGSGSDATFALLL